MLLAACTNAEMQERRMNKGLNETSEVSKKCLDEVTSNEKYTQIIAHIPIAKGYTPTLSELNNNNKPTPQEAQLVAELRDASIGCEQTFIQGLMQYTPSLAPVFVQMQNDKNDNYSLLVSRKITWGKFAKEDQQIMQKVSSLASEKWQEIQNQLAYQKNMESIQLQEALRQAAEINLRQQEIQAQQNAATQNRMMNCTSYQQGYYVNTNCF